MTPEQARAAHLAYVRLYQYMSADAEPQMVSEAELRELTYGNFLAAETLLGILAKLHGKTFDRVLDELPQRDEGYPPGSAARYMWDHAIYRLRYMHARSWQHRPEPARTYSLLTTFRGSFNLVVAATIEVGATTKTPARHLASTLRDAAAGATR